METKHRIMEIIDSNKETITDADYLSCSNWLMRAEDPEAGRRPGAVHVFVDIARQVPQVQHVHRWSPKVSAVFFICYASSYMCVLINEFSKGLAFYFVVSLLVLSLVFQILEFSELYTD